uniref:Uncharacterized protein n=1 Tax=Rhizophora mucronata TaxID=61149 RepID=A0A2P2PDL9_RHIMU
MTFIEIVMLGRIKMSTLEHVSQKINPIYL